MEGGEIIEELHKDFHSLTKGKLSCPAHIHHVSYLIEDEEHSTTGIENEIRCLVGGMKIDPETKTFPFDAGVVERTEVGEEPNRMRPPLAMMRDRPSVRIATAAASSVEVVRRAVRAVRGSSSSGSARRRMASVSAMRVVD